MSDAAHALRAIDDIQHAAAGLYESALDPNAQERMRRTLEPARLAQAGQAASRVARLQIAAEGV